MKCTRDLQLPQLWIFDWFKTFIQQLSIFLFLAPLMENISSWERNIKHYKEAYYYLMLGNL